ncbi:hypothetical protein [Micromonospora sp. NPDC004704]
MTEPTSATRARVIRTLCEQRIETPSWAYGNSATRFEVFLRQAPSLVETPWR